LYPGEATYTGTCDFKWSSPEVGARHKLILFLSQAEGEPQQALAFQEISRFGFGQVVLKPGKPISVEALNEPKMQAFQKHYEGALDAGSSIVWYPERLQQPAA
jgi:hypothetical protein